MSLKTLSTLKQIGIFYSPYLAQTVENVTFLKIDVISIAKILFSNGQFTQDKHNLTRKMVSTIGRKVK
jgi:hypothetical protein